MAKTRARITEDNNPLSSTDQVLAGFQQLSNSTSNNVDNSTSNNVDNSTSNNVNKLTSNEVSKSVSNNVDKTLMLRKATFQISDSVLNNLERFHLQLQLELGKKQAPYKEVIVEQAIAYLLEEAAKNKDGLIEVLQERQKLRD